MSRRKDDIIPPGQPSPTGDDQKTVTVCATNSEASENPQTDTTFSPNEVLADRFKIARFIAQGGMGKVYEADDLVLQERVALKTLRPEIASDETAILRFKREIRLARKITHPNVCRIYDIFEHKTTSPDGQSKRIIFLSMELLHGETLHNRIRRSGPLTSAEAFPLIRQMASALESAHCAGVIHRDFKSANVMLVPRRNDAEEIRTVVTDFGLARPAVPASDLSTSVHLAAIAGTPAYMAPEQIEGGEITAAVDIYAMGIVLYEMVTGTVPFSGDTPLSCMVKRLKEPPPSPRRVVPSLEPHWERAILRCLETNPADRFASAAQVSDALKGELALGPTLAEQQILKRKKKRRTWIVVAGLVAALLVAFVILQFQLARKREKTADSPSSSEAIPRLAARRSIAVLGFKNRAARPDAEWLSTAFSEMMSTELSAGERLRTISGENVARMKVELSLSDVDSFAKDTLESVGRNLGAGLVVFGSYFALGPESGGQIRFDLRLQDTASGEVISAFQETGTEARLFDLVSHAGATLRQKLGIQERPASAIDAVRAALPSNPEAARLYSEGLARLRLFDGVAGRDLLQKAVAIEPDHALAHSALGAAWSTLGYDTRAKEEASKAFDLSAELSREERLSVEGRFREMAREWDKAIEIYRTLWGFFPDNVNYGLRLAAVQNAAGKGKDALETLEAIRKLPAPDSGDPRIDIEEAYSAKSLSDFRRQQSAASAGVKKATEQGAHLLVARARMVEGDAYLNLGEPQKATASWEDARRLYAEAGDRGGGARALNNMGTVFYQQGDLPEARKKYEESQIVARDLGDAKSIANALNNLAAVLRDQADFKGAMAMHQEALAIRKEIGDKSGTGVALNNIANILADQGDQEGALKMYQEALAIRREVYDRRGSAFTLLNIGLLLKDHGHLTSAKTKLNEALTLCGEIGNKRLSADALSGLGLVLTAEGSLQEALKKYEDSLAIHREFGDKGGATRVRLYIGELALNQGRPAEAEVAAREASDLFHRQKAVSNEARAWEILSKSLLAQRKSSAAKEAIDRAAALVTKVGHRLVRLEVEITRARVRAALRQTAEARSSLKDALAQAKTAGFKGAELEAQLALGEVELKAGDISGGRTRLLALEQEAESRGFGLLAKKAAAQR